MQKLFWGVSALTLGLASYLILIAGPYLKAEAGGLTLFDLRHTGYSPFEAQAFLTNLSPTGYEFYLNIWWPLDTVFLVSLGLFSSLLIRALYRGGAAYWPTIANILPIAYIVFDFSENRQVKRMMQAGIEAVTEPEMVAANMMTVLKFTAFFLILVIILGGMIRQYRLRRAAR